MMRMAWSDVSRWRQSPQITSLFPLKPKGSSPPPPPLYDNKANLPKSLGQYWLVQSPCTCHRCRAHLYSNKQLSLMPAARGGAGSLAWVTAPLGESMQVCCGL